MYLLLQPPKHPLLLPTLSSKSKNAITTRYNQLNWRQVGKIEKLHLYPLIGGREIYCPKCSFTETSMTGMLNDAEYSNCMQTVRVRACIQTDLIINITEVILRGEKVICTTSFCQKFVTEIKCFDCGPKAATWLSRYLNVDNVRLAYVLPSHLMKSPCQKNYQPLCSKQLDKTNITIPTLSPTYTLTPCPLRDQFSLNVVRAVERRVFKPHIYVQTSYIYDVYEWNWIMIGNVILRNIKQLPRWRRNINWREVPVQKLLRFLPIECELIIPGQAEVNDYVYVKKLKKK